MKSIWSLICLSGLLIVASARPAARNAQIWGQLRENVSALKLSQPSFTNITI